MRVEVNLLPAAYRREVQRTLWLRRGAAFTTVLVAFELSVGLGLHMAGGSHRDLDQELAATRAQIRYQQQELDDLNRQIASVGLNLRLARELRASHPWSRLLAALAEAAPEGLVLTHVGTEPPRWSQAAPPARSGSVQADNRTPAGQSGRESPPGIVTVMTGLTIRGLTGDHQGLSQFMSRLHEIRLFSTLDLTRMQRDRFGAEEVIAFELQGQW